MVVEAGVDHVAKQFDSEPTAYTERLPGTGRVHCGKGGVGVRDGEAKFGGEAHPFQNSPGGVR